MSIQCYARWICLLTSLLVVAHVPRSHGQGPPQAERAGPSAHELRREWVRRQLPKVVSDEAELAALNARLDDLNPFEINELATAILDSLQAERNARTDALWAAVRRSQAEEEQARQAVGPAQPALPPSAWGLHGPINPYASFYPPYVPVAPFAYPSYGPVTTPFGVYAPPAIGYAPIVTWLPQGVSMNASAVVTPDGRHVRTYVNPFFSTIGPIHTFNYATGEYRSVEPYPSRRDRPQRSRTYYDGLRTRTEVPQR